MRAKHLLVGLMVLSLIAWLSSNALAQPNLLGHWPLDSDLRDAVGDNHGRFVDIKEGARVETNETLEFVPTQWGNGLHFTGPITCVEIARAPELEPADSLTMFVRVNFDQLSERQEIATYGDSYVIILESGIQTFIFNNGDWLYSDSGVEPLTGEWYSIAITYNGADVNVFVNGELSGTRAVPGVITYQDAPFMFGCNFVDAKWLFENNREWWLMGFLDDVSVWDAPMTEAEVMAMHETGTIAGAGTAVGPRGKLATIWGERKASF